MRITQVIENSTRRPYNTAEDWTSRGLEASAFANTDGSGFSMKVSQHFATAEERDTFAAQFPKSAKIRTCTMIGMYDFRTYTIEAKFSFTSGNVTGDRNETAIKRFRSFNQRADKLGLEFTWTKPYANSADWADVEAHIA